MTISRLCIAVGVGALLISVQLCLAAEGRRQVFESWWSTSGEQIKTELASLPDKGRKAFREALLACSLYAEEYNSTSHRDECQKASKYFVLEFSRNSSAINHLFRMAISMTAIWALQVELDHMHGQRDITDDDTRRGSIDVLEKAYRETKERKL